MHFCISEVIRRSWTCKEEPGRRFQALVEKVWREDFLLAAWGMVRRNGGAAGVDGETVADIGAHGVERWVGELSRDLREGTYEPSPVRQVLIPKKQPGKFRALGIPCLRDRVAQTSAMLVLSPIFEADLEAGAVRIPAGTKRQGRGQADPPPAAHGPQRSDRCGPLELLR